PDRHSAGFEARLLNPLDLCALDNDGYGDQHEAQLPARAGIAAVKLSPTDHQAVTAGFVANKTVLPAALALQDTAMTDHPRRVNRALLSVSDKSGLIDFARALVGHGIELISTGGTAKEIAEAGRPGGARRAHRQRRRDDAAAATSSGGESLCAHGLLRRRDLKLVRSSAQDRDARFPRLRRPADPGAALWRKPAPERRILSHAR